MTSTIEKYVKHYNDHYLVEGESGSGQLTWQPQYEIWLKAGYKPSMSVLDYGCGVGIMLEAGLKDYLGVDISSEAIRLAQKRYPKATFKLFTMGELSSGRKDVAVAQSVFTHTPKNCVDRCLKDIARSFKDFAVIDILLGDDSPFDEHVRYFTESEWHSALESANLRGIKIGDHDYVGYNHIYYKVTHA